MTDRKPEWRDVGDALRKEVQANSRALAERLFDEIGGVAEGVHRVRLDVFLKEPSRPSPGMQAALADHAKGNPTALIRYLKSNNLWTAEDRSAVADLFEDHTGGRPRDDDLRTAATLARVFYDEWRAWNRKLGVDDRGLAEAMKDDAAQFIVSDFYPERGEAFHDTVRDTMDRPGHRRDPGDAPRIAIRF